MNEWTPILAILKDPALLVTLAPLGLIFLGVITFEVAIGVTISTLPRSRFKHKWTPQEQRRVLRVFCVVFSVWPITASLILAHAFLPLWFALLADLLVVAIIAACIRWLIHGVKQRKLVLAGHCANCFYDLRANKQSDQCPECGTELHDHPVRAGPGNRAQQSA
ncbi:MAG: hypothetical protein KTR15_12020 [Phycisphaeraceae bacterium]|nr:hypothetical protein [Phycisphaeraceae bacterium]